MIKKTAFFSISIFTMFFFVISPVSAKTVKIKLVSSYSIRLPVAGAGYKYFLDTVEMMSGGDIKIKWYEPGKLVPGTAVLDTVSKGLAQMGASSPTYYAGKMPSAPMFQNLPFGPEIPERLSWMYHGNGLKLWQELYDKAGYNVKVLPLLQIPAESMGWFGKPIPDDGNLSGLKIRVGGLGGKIFDKMGASVTFMPIGDIFTALERGALDACEFSFPSIDAALGFSKVAKYNYWPGWHTPAGSTSLLINKDVWEKEFTAQQRKIIETAALATQVWSMALAESTQADVVINNAEKKSVKNMKVSPQLLNRFRKAWEEVVREESAKDPMFKKIWDDLSAFRARYAVWKDLAFVKD